jgi:hypothetical protein
MNSKNIDWNGWEAKEISFDDKRGECRICKHTEYWHLKERPSCSYNINNEAKARWAGHIGEILVPRKIKLPICPCLEYVPGNNLEYLEWLHHKKC